MRDLVLCWTVSVVNYCLLSQCGRNSQCLLNGCVVVCNCMLLLKATLGMKE